MKLDHNKLHLLTALLIVAFVAIAFGSMESEEAVEQSVSDDISAAESSDEVLVVSAHQMYSDYDTNEVAADEKYEGRIVEVTGTVEDIGKDLTETMYVTLSTPDFIMVVQCFFADKHKSQVGSIRKGQILTLIGKCDGKFGNILVRGCRITD